MEYDKEKIIMDSFLFIGYRIDCRKPCSKKVGWGHSIKEVKDIPINNGGPLWSYWNYPSGGTDTFLYGKYSYYRCPFGHYSLWEDIDRKPLDLPDNHFEILHEIMNDPIMDELAQRYNEVIIKYGIMKGLG